MRDRYSFSVLLIPLLTLVVLAFIMIIERSGLNYKITEPSQVFLPPLVELKIDTSNVKGNKTLVLFDSQDFAAVDHVDTVSSTLESLRVPFEIKDISEINEVQFSDYDAIVISFLDYDKATSDVLDLIDWVEQGGKVFISIRPDPSTTFLAIYRKLGILSMVPYLDSVSGVKFITDFMPGTKDKTYGMDFIQHTSFPVELEESARTHLTSAGEIGIPLLWEYRLGNGRFVITNSDQFTTKISRGVIGAGYSLLFDVFAFPVINIVEIKRINITKTGSFFISFI